MRQDRHQPARDAAISARWERIRDYRHAWMLTETSEPAQKYCVPRRIAKIDHSASRPV